MSENRTSNTGLFRQLKSYSKTFWIANSVEMLERLAYYGLRTVLPIFMVLSIEQGGPQFDHTQKGFIFAWWALIQSMVPVFTGGYADRYGYKLTVGISIAVKMLGYVVMGFAIEIAGILTGGESLKIAGDTTTLYVFCAGAWLLALGTAIFKPGIQGILAHQLNEENEATGWAVFYQIVNVGGFLGPFLAGVLRILAWRYVFLACAVIVALNYILLFTFSEPPRESGAEESEGSFLDAFKVLWNGAIGICEPRLLSFLVIFSGFWFMFNQLFDMLPNYIEQWVDTSGPFSAWATVLPTSEKWQGQLPQEMMINLNSGMIMLTAFAFGYLAGKFRSMVAMLIGIFISTAAIYSIGASTNGWVVLGCIALFSIGEMSASPTKLRYFASIAPPGKKGMYLGYINATNGFGWYVGSLVAGELYQEKGDIFVLGRRHLESLGMTAKEVHKDVLAQTEVLPTIAEKAGIALSEVQGLLYTTYSPQQIWPYFASIGLVSMFGLIVFDQLTRRNLAFEPQALLALTFLVALFSYGLFYATLFTVPMVIYLVLQKAAPQWLPDGQAEASD